MFRSVIWPQPSGVRLYSFIYTWGLHLDVTYLFRRMHSKIKYIPRKSKNEYSTIRRNCKCLYMYIKRTDWNLYINLRETKKIKKEIKKIHKNHKYSELTGRENPFDLTNVLENKHERIFWGYSRYGVLIKVEIKILCCVYINRNSSVRRKSLCNRNSHHMRVWHWCRAGHQHKWIRYHRTLRWSHLQYICFV